jgi:endonuclease/exonuclease/phosphatase family metal-dependent hydrolase
MSKKEVLSRVRWALGLGMLTFAGCGPKTATTPPAPAPVAQAEPEPEPPPPAPPPKVPDDAIAVGTFNLNWAFDHLEDSRPKQARPYVPTTAEDWEWKRDRIVEILAAEKLDIVALSEVGGEREIGDIVFYIRDKGGPDYDWAWLPGTDTHTGQQVAILSRFPIRDVRRFGVHIDKHVAADIELPGGTVATVVALHMLEGAAPAYASKRRKAARALVKQLAKASKGQPLIMLGTLNSPATRYDDGYDKSLPAILANKANAKEEDDCFDSGDEATRTTIHDEAFDRIITCGLELRSADISAEDTVTRDSMDPDDAPWPGVPIEAQPYRDVSDHYVVWAEVALPPPPAAEGDAEASDVATH